MPITGRPAMVGAPGPPPATVVVVLAPVAAPPVSESVTDEKRFARDSCEPSSVGMSFSLAAAVPERCRRRESPSPARRRQPPPSDAARLAARHGPALALPGARLWPGLP